MRKIGRFHLVLTPSHEGECMNKRVSVLGSTGSIGTQTLDVARALGFSVPVLAAHSNIVLLEAQIRAFRPAVAVVFDEKKAAQLKLSVADLPVRVLAGMEGLCEAAAYEQTDVVLNAVVGMVGLQPTLCAIEAGKDLALANKETLVAGGALVMNAAREKGVRMLPVDSEHSAIFQCLQGCPPGRPLHKIILTASGGPFFGKTAEELRTITPEQALKHPNWDMGSKITIDSASLMNKGLEIIEAAWLFDMSVENIDVVVHRESVIHSLIEYNDHSVIAQLGVPDMKIPIQFALTYPERVDCAVRPLNLIEYGALTFYPPDEETFLCLKACKKAIQRGGLAPAAANGANEAANRLFQEGKIGFLQIGTLVMEAMERQPDAPCARLEDVLEADRQARDYVHRTI